MENGCRCLAFLRVGTSLVNEPNKRKDGFVSACEEYSIPYALQMINDGTPYSVFAEFLQVNLVLDDHPEKAPSLICLPVSYAYGGTTRQ